MWGEKKFWSAVFEKLDIDMTDGLTNFLEQKDKTCVWRQGYKGLTTTKIKRKKGVMKE